MIMGRNDELYESQLIPLMYCYFAEIGLDFTLSYSWRIVEIVKDKQSILSEWQKSSTFNDAVWEARKYTFCKIMHCYGQQFLADCGNAGGDWEIVSSMIDSLCPNAIICKLPD